MDSDQLYYLETVLGLKNVVMPAVAFADVTTAQQLSDVSVPAEVATPLDVQMSGDFASARLIIVWGRKNSPAGHTGPMTPLDDSATELTDKMLAAMKVPGGKVAKLEWTLANTDRTLPIEVLEVLELAGQTPVLIFGRNTALALLPTHEIQLGQWIQSGTNRYMTTYSPEELLESNDKKRMAWAHLQLVMKTF